MEKIENFYYRKTVGYCDNQPVITCTNIRLNICQNVNSNIEVICYKYQSIYENTYDGFLHRRSHLIP